MHLRPHRSAPPFAGVAAMAVARPAHLAGFDGLRGLAVLAVALVVAALTREWRGTVPHAPYYVNMLPDPPAPRELGHYWTLAVEEQFYLVWPFAVLSLSRRRLAWVCVAIPLGDTVARAALWLGHSAYATPHVLGNATITRADPLAVGALLALLLAARRQVSTRALWLVGGLASATLAAMQAAVVLTDRLHTTQYVLQPLVLAVLVGVVPQSVIQAPPAWLSSRWLAYLGTISYGVYIVHGVLATWFVAHIESNGLRVGGLMAVSVALAAVSWRVLEQPVLRLKRRWPMPRRVRADGPPRA